MKVFIILFLLIFSIILIPSVSAITFPQLESQMITVTTDKKSYSFGEDVIITGTSTHLPEEKLRYTYFLAGRSVLVDENGNFTKTIPPHNFGDTPRRFIVQVQHQHENNTTHSVETDFNYGLENVKTITDEQYANQISFSIDKQAYNAGDTITLAGSAPKEYVWNGFNFKIIDPKNNIVSRMQVAVDKNGNFNGTISTNDFKVNGEYKIELHVSYTDSKFSTNFQYNDPEIIDIVELDKQVQKIDDDVKTLQVDLDSLQLQFNNFQEFINQQLALIFQMFNATTP